MTNCLILIDCDKEKNWLERFLRAGQRLRIRQINAVILKDIFSNPCSLKAMQWKFIQHNEVFIAYQPNRYHRCRLTTTLRWNGIYLTWPIKKPILCAHITMHVRCKLSKGHHLLGVIYASQKLGRAPNMNIKRLYLQYCINSLCRNYRSAMPVITDFFIDSFLLTVFLIRNFRDTNF